MWVSVGAWGVSEESAPFLSRLMTQSAPTFIKRINESAVANRLFQKSTTRKISANLRLLVRERSRYDLKTMILSEDIMNYREKNALRCICTFALKADVSLENEWKARSILFGCS